MVGDLLQVSPQTFDAMVKAASPLEDGHSSSSGAVPGVMEGVCKGGGTDL